MLAFLLAWIEAGRVTHKRAVCVVFIAAALASSFGLSIYVSFGFFLMVVFWALWQVAVEHVFRPTLLLTSGGAGAVVLLLPYLFELRHGTSGIHGGSIFGFAVRETFSADGVLASELMQPLAHSHPIMALNLGRLILLLPGIAVELGVFLLAFLAYLVPGWRGRRPLTLPEKSLVFIAVTILLISSFIRSNVLDINDFGVRSALFLQFGILLMASQIGLNMPDRSAGLAGATDGLQYKCPTWIRSISRLAIILGAMTTIHQAIILRFTIPIANAVTRMRPVNDSVAANLPHNTYISAIGYAELDGLIPRDAIVQYNPYSPNVFWLPVDFVGIDHQTAISSDKPWCGAELGGDPSGCPEMAEVIDGLYSSATADQARATCHQFGIRYLVAKIYDHVWQDKQSWVWTLSPVVSDEEFRALDCR